MGEPPLETAAPTLHIIQDPDHVLTYMEANLEYAFHLRKTSTEIPTDTFDFTLGVGLLRPLRDQMEIPIGQLFMELARKNSCQMVFMEWSVVPVQDTDGLRYTVSVPFVRFESDNKQLLDMFSSVATTSSVLQ